jgi:hypothetical protein
MCHGGPPSSAFVRRPTAAAWCGGIHEGTSACSMWCVLPLLVRSFTRSRAARRRRARRELFRVRSPPGLDSRASSQVAMPAVLSASGDDTSLSRPLHRARSGHESLRPELAAPLGVWPSSQLAQCAGGRAGWRLSGAVAVLLCCTAPASSARAPGCCSRVDRPFFRRSGLPVWLIDSKRGWMLSCVRGRDWLAPLLSSLRSGRTQSGPAAGARLRVGSGLVRLSRHR